MKQAKIQKNINLSSQKIKNIIEKRSADIAQKLGQSTSLVVERALMSGLFPQNKEANSLTINYLYSDDSDNIKNALNAAFANNAAGIDWKAKHSNFLPVVIFCLKYYKGPEKFTGKEHELHHLLEQLFLIIKRINNCVNGIINAEEKSFFDDKAKNAMTLITHIKETPEEINPYDVFELISDFFAMLDDWSITYRALSDLTSICTFEESARNRIELFDIISRLSADWETKTEKENDYETTINTEFYLNRVTLKFTKEDRLTDNPLTVYANDACVGNVIAAMENLIWNSGGNYNPKYQFRNEDIFAAVVAELKKYKDEHGFKYLVIDNHSNGFASVLDPVMIRRAGFRQLPDNNPALYFLE